MIYSGNLKIKKPSLRNVYLLLFWNVWNDFAKKSLQYVGGDHAFKQDLFLDVSSFVK